MSAKKFEVEILDNGAWRSQAADTGESRDDYICESRAEAALLLAHMVEQYGYSPEQIRIIEVQS